MRSFTNVMPANTAMSCQWADILLLWDVIKAVLLRDPSLLFMSFNQSLSQMAFHDSAKKSNFSLGHLWSRIMKFLWVYYTVLFTCKRTSPTWKSQNCWRNPRFCPPPTLPPGPPLPSILIQTDAASPDDCRCCSRTALHTRTCKNRSISISISSPPLSLLLWLAATF